MSIAKRLVEDELERESLEYLQEGPVQVPCNTHPKAPHGFDQDASHSADRYVCECESWEPDWEPEDDE